MKQSSPTVVWEKGENGSWISMGAKEKFQQQGYLEVVSPSQRKAINNIQVFLGPKQG